MALSDKDLEKIELMQQLRKGEIDTLPDVDSDEFKLSKIKDMISKAEGVDEVTSRVGSRIEGLLNIEMKNKFLNAGMDLIQDVLEDDEFFIEDIVDHLAIELNKYYDERSSFGAKINDLEEKVEEDINEGDPIVDEHEFNFFQTLFTPKYSKEEIEAFLKSDDYQEELKYSDLEEKDFANWDNALDMFVHKADRRGGRLDEGVKWMKRFSGVK